MPRIPVTTAQPTRTGFISGGGIRQISQPSIGQGLQSVGSELQETALIFQRADNIRQLNNEKTKALKDLSAFRQQLESDPDSFDTWTIQHEEYNKQVLENARGRLNSAVFEEFRNQYNEFSTRSVIQTQSMARNVLVDKGRADLISNLEAFNDLYIVQENEEQRKKILGQASLLISDAQDTGIISEQDATTNRINFLQSVEESRLSNDILENPELAKVNFENGEYLISEESKPAFQSKIQIRVDAIEREKIQIKERQEREQEKLRKEQQEALEIDFIDLMNNDKLTEKQIISAGQSRLLTPSQVRTLLSDLNKEDKENSDPAVYVDYLGSILDGTMNVGQVLKEPGLSPKDKKTFSNMITVAENKDVTEEEKRLKEDQKNITSAIRPYIVTTGPLAEFVKQDEQILLQTAIQEINDRLNAGEDPESIKFDIIQRYSRAPLNTEQLPRLRYGSSDNLEFAKQIVSQKFREGEIDLATANREAELIEKYEQAIKNNQQIEKISQKRRK